MDRLTKTLLTLIAAALWGLLLRPLLAPGPAGAAPPHTTILPGVPAIATPASYGNVALVVQNGVLYRVDFSSMHVTGKVSLR